MKNKYGVLLIIESCGTADIAVVSAKCSLPLEDITFQYVQLTGHTLLWNVTHRIPPAHFCYIRQE